MILMKLYWAFFKIGALGFGGGMAIVGMIYDTIRGFVSMTPSQYADIVAIAQVTPGPVAVNTATYVGYQVGGIFGSFIATLGVATPAFILVAIVASMINRYKESKVVQGALEGIRPATVGLIFTAALTICRPAIQAENPLGGSISAISGLLPSHIDGIAILMCIATIVLIKKFHVNALYVLLIMGCVGAVIGV